LDFYFSLFMLRCRLLLSFVLILVMSLFMFRLFTCILHCQVLVLFIFVISLYVCVSIYMLKLLLCESGWLMFIVYAYVCRHNYIFYFAFICLHVFFLCGLHSRGINIFTNFTFWIWTWYVCIFRKRRHRRLERYRPLKMGSQV
jgi:hypothetical protein